MNLPPSPIRKGRFALLQKLSGQPAFSAFMMAAGIITAFCLAFNPRWETNDDVGMSMRAHGYGYVAYGSPNLVYSNVLWGYLVRAIPAINGVLGYSIATLAVLLVAGWAILYFLLRFGAGYLTGLLAIILIVARPTLFPQFTMNAGLLTVAAVIGWQVYARVGGVGNLAAACLLAFFGYLIRDKEFLLVLGVALPLLPWRALREWRQMQVAFLLLGMAIASAAAFDHWSYSGPEWQNFKEVKASITSFVNYGAGRQIKQHPEIMARHGYSKNDVALISNWFFVDPQIADPKSLNAMLAELGPLPMQEGSFQSGITALKALADPVLLPLILPALLLLVLAPSRVVILAWMLCLAALFAIGIMGRPGVLRVYVPLISLLFAAPLVLGKCKEGIRQKITALILFAACIGNAYVLIPQALESKQEMQQAQKDIHSLGAGFFVSWGSAFPFESAYPVLSNDIDSRNIRLYALNTVTLAPFSVATAEQAAGRGMVERLRTGTGIPIILSNEQIGLLRVYCMERLNSQLRILNGYDTPLLSAYQIRCERLAGGAR